MQLTVTRVFVPNLMSYFQSLLVHCKFLGSSPSQDSVVRLPLEVKFMHYVKCGVCHKKSYNANNFAFIPVVHFFSICLDVPHLTNEHRTHHRTTS